MPAPTRATAAFDIGDPNNAYAACPHCRSTLGMGLVTRQARVAVECFDCGFRGPSGDTDRTAFNLWNLIDRTNHL